VPEIHSWNEGQLERRWLSAAVLARDIYRGADKSLARSGRKQATATEGSEYRISYL